MLSKEQQIEAEKLIQDFGDKVSDMFEQLIKGNWIDDNDHAVANNSSMIALKSILVEAIEHRAKVGLASVSIEERFA